MSRALPVALLLLLVLGTGGLFFVLRAPRDAHAAIEVERALEITEDSRLSELSMVTTSPGDPVSASERTTAADSVVVDRADASRACSSVSIQGAVRFSGASLLPRPAELVWTHESGSRRTCTSTNGIYWIRDLEQGAWRVVCSSPGYRPHERQFRIEHDKTQPSLDFDLVAEHLIPVRFVDSAGSPLWERATGAMRSPNRELEVDVQRARLAPSAIPQADVGVILTFEEPPRRLPKRVLTASVLREKRLVGGKFPDWKAAEWKAAENELAELRHDAPGVYAILHPWDRKRLGESLRADADGVVELWTTRPVFASAIVRDVVLQSVALDPGASEIVFMIDRAALTELTSKLVARIVESGTGASLPGARIDLGHVRWSHFSSEEIGAVQIEALWPGTRVDPSHARPTGDSSEQSAVVRIEGLSPGPQDVTVSAPDHASIEMTVDLPVGETKDLGTIELARAVEIKGCLLDPRGAPIQGRVRFLEGGPSDRGESRREVIIDAGKDGCFHAMLAMTRWFVEGAGGMESNGKWREGSELGSAPVLLDLGLGPVDGLMLQLQPTTFVRVLGQDEFAVLDATSSVVLRSGSAGGRADQLYLVPGTYRLRVGAAEAPIRQRPIAIAGEGMKLDLSQ
jgi:hypothetical protein